MTRIVSLQEQLRNLAQALDSLPAKDRKLVQACIDKTAEADTRRLDDDEAERIDEIWREHFS